MPKRVLDGDAMWGSEKIRALPAWAKAEFPWLLPLAMANGVFECDRRRIWAICYAYARPEMTIEQLDEVLHAFVIVGLLFRWFEPDGKEWGYWVGIEKPGRLLAPSRIKRKESVCGPPPPQPQLNQYVRNTYEGRVGLGRVSQDHMLCSKSSSEPHKAPRNGCSPASVDDLRKSFLSKCEDPDGTLGATLDIIIERAESSGVKIQSENYLDTAIRKFNFQGGKDKEELMQRIRHV